jgi:NADPH:quinone reductase
VLATATAPNHATLRDLGANVLIDYRAQDVATVVLSETGGRGVDAAFDIQGSPLVSRCLPAVRPFGRFACILEPEGDLSLLYQKNIALHGIFLTREGARLEEMRPLFERGQARAIIDQVLRLEQVGEAHMRLDTGHGRGKVVLRV